MVLKVSVSQDSFIKVFASPTDPLALGVTKKGRMLLFSLVDGSIIAEKQFPYDKEKKIRFSKSGDYIIVGDNETVKIYRADSLEFVREYNFDMKIIDWTENSRGKLLGILLENGDVYVWDYTLDILLEKWDFGGDVLNCGLYFIDNDHKIAIIGEEEAIALDLLTKEVSISTFTKVIDIDENFDANEWYTMIIEDGDILVSAREDLDEDPIKIFQKMPGYYRGLPGTPPKQVGEKLELTGKEDPDVEIKSEDIGIGAKQRGKKSVLEELDENSPLSKDSQLVKSAMAQIKRAKRFEERKHAEMILYRLAYTYSVEREDLELAYEKFSNKGNVNLILAAKGLHDIRQQITKNGIKWGSITLALQLLLVFFYIFPPLFLWSINFTAIIRLLLFGGTFYSTTMFMKYRFNTLGRISSLEPFMVSILLGWILIIITYLWNLIITAFL